VGPSSVCKKATRIRPRGSSGYPVHHTDAEGAACVLHWTCDGAGISAQALLFRASSYLPGSAWVCVIEQHLRSFNVKKPSDFDDLSLSFSAIGIPPFVLPEYPNPRKPFEHKIPPAGLPNKTPVESTGVKVIYTVVEDHTPMWHHRQ
jgi:hypothetical protein